MRKFAFIAVVLTAAISATAAAQSARHGSTDVTGAIPPAQAEPAPSAPPWSGEDGASGDPSMSATAIRQAAANFHNCLERLWPQAARRHVSRAVFERYTRALTPDLRIMDLMDNQPEFTKSIWDYLDLLVTDERIAKGRALLEKYSKVFDAEERAYGVSRYIVTAIWGVESDFGTEGGERPVLRSTATLACIGRRQNYFRQEFLATLDILQHGDIAPDRLVGSWAGAFGPTQFMPTAFERYAVDFDHDGRRDVVDSVPDIVASTANNLKQDGWIGGETWGYEVLVPANFNFMLADRHRTLPIGEWERFGIKRAHGLPFPRLNERAFLLMPAGAQGPGFLMLHNFRVIMRYNPAEAYALAIGHLADRLAGGGPFAQKWPRYERVLSRDERLELQERLARLGYDVGEPDGRFGVKTRAAIRAFQARNGKVPDGLATAVMLNQLRGQ
jgi:peptidoglycan lytic transglycosylase B